VLGGDAGIAMFGLNGASAPDTNPSPVSRTLPLNLCAPGTALDQSARSRPTLPLTVPLTGTSSLTNLHHLPQVNNVNVGGAQGPRSVQAFFPSTGGTQPTISASGFSNHCQ